MRELTIFVCSYNSASTLGACLDSIKLCEQDSPVVLIDQESTDSSQQIGRDHGAEVHVQGIGLGYARQMAFELANTEFLAFVDSDEEVVGRDFFRRAVAALHDSQVGAVTGMAVGHKFQYGLPMGLLVLRSKDFRGKVVPPEVGAREEIFVQRRLRSLGLSTLFLRDAMVHRSQNRRYKPEWEGASTRIAAGLSFRQLAFVFEVILLQSLNSRSIRNLVYTPVFYFKFLKGYVQPQAWRKLRLGN